VDYEGRLLLREGRGGNGKGARGRREGSGPTSGRGESGGVGRVKGRVNPPNLKTKLGRW